MTRGAQTKKQEKKRLKKIKKIIIIEWLHSIASPCSVPPNMPRRSHIMSSNICKALH